MDSRLDNLVKNLHQIAEDCRADALCEPPKYQRPYLLAYQAIWGLAEDIQQLDPVITRVRTRTLFGKRTLGHLTESHLGDAYNQIVAFSYKDKKVYKWLWPAEATYESFSLHGKGIRLTGESHPDPAGSAMRAIGKAVLDIASILPFNLDYRRPTLCRICYRHTDPYSKSVHCLKHTRTSGQRPSSDYKRGQSYSKLAVETMSEPNQKKRWLRFKKEMVSAFQEQSNDRFYRLLCKYCPTIIERCGMSINNNLLIKEAILQIGLCLDDYYLGSWLEYIDNKLNNILPEKQFNPKKTQIIDPIEIKRRLTSLRNEVTTHLIVWLVGAESFLYVENAFPIKRGRPKQENTVSETIKTLLLKKKYSKQEIIAITGASRSLVYQVAKQLGINTKK